jgi:hypothetical protein
MNVLRKKLETTGLKIERCVVDFMLLPIEKGKVYFHNVFAYYNNLIILLASCLLQKKI